HHGDPLRGEGSLVCTDFGEDLIEGLKNLNLPTEIISREIFYTPDQIPLLEERKDYKRYLEWKAKGKLLNFLLYNSIVFRTPKAKTGSNLAWTGERFVPWVEDPIIQYEHLHRYAYAKQFVSGKRVIDLACGEGYGSDLLAETAASVIGLDIDELSIRHASQKYQRANLKFIQGSITAIPIQGRGILDVAVCFEALEHIFEQTQLLKEVKRLLSPEGILLISTPNKKIYSDDPVYRNPFHVKEMYFEEFREELSALFSNVFFFGQKIFPASNIFPLGENNGISQALAVEKKEGGFAFSPFSKKPARYFLALATDGKRIGEVAPGESYLVDLSETCRISPVKTRLPIVPAAGILEARYRKIQDLLLQGKEDQALRSLEEFVENFPQSGLAHNDLAVLALGRGEMDKALRHYEKAVELEPENITFKKNLGEFYFVVQQDKPKAEKILSMILEKNPDDGETLALLGEICIRSGSMAEGETYFRRAIEVDPENEKAHNFLQALSEKKVGRKEALPRPKQEGGVPPALKNADPETCNRMKEDWNKRAEEDPKYYIHSTARDQTEEEFDRSGKENVKDLILKDQTILSAAKPFSHMRTLEIGCGMGRMTKHLAELFEEVHGIDVSGEMIRLARVRTAHLQNVFLYEGNGRDLEVFPDEFFDLAFSFIVFQHIPDKAVILNYIREAGRVLKTAGLFKFQVQGCTDPRWLRLPKDTWQGETVTEEEIRSISEEIGCEVISLKGQGTQYSFYTLRKRGREKEDFQRNLPAGPPPRRCSIVIPVFNKIEYTRKCLEAVRRNTPSDLYELIIVDNASNDGTGRFLSAYKERVRIISNPVNVGFTKACNQGAREASGEFILFLNNDTEPQAGWLEALLEIMDEHPEAGVVGSKLIYPDGRLQEAGGIIFRDGTGWNFGRLDSPGRPPYNYLREVDYVSGASLLIRTSLFQKLGLFDEQYSPGYYEDTDICFGARAMGYKVFYSPFSRVIHHEGISSG
ncbi:MAG: glycosyl transferase, partial [Deltaproteobacteria bacterium]|nr:glycosyl transferase [Deltaproteobacteria bacterium]